ncbi:MAG: fumarylacetoacetate hydrolase family protein [Deltaproteobacteria bacterium]|nr:fumarylacetoacetate hydrolase family protein [Deltaproteobacteria bacterium]
MKIMRFVYREEMSYGVVSGENLRKIEGWPSGPYKVAEETIRMEEVKVLAPLMPGKIVAVGLNYASHVAEVSKEQTAPPAPLLFLKPPTSIIGPGEGIFYPEKCKALHYEGELAVIIKNRTRKIQTEEAADHILGYTCLNDVTARDWQMSDGQWTRGKSYDTFCPIGPVIALDIKNPNDLRIETRLNGQVKQSASTADLLFKVEELVSYISHYLTLLPGDIIATGTPEGVGPMKVGDTVEVEIEEIGVLRNQVIVDPGE